MHAEQYCDRVIDADEPQFLIYLEKFFSWASAETLPGGATLTFC